jgi:hypothetical protein
MYVTPNPFQPKGFLQLFIPEKPSSLTFGLLLGCLQTKSPKNDMMMSEKGRKHGGNMKCTTSTQLEVCEATKYFSRVTCPMIH